MKETQEASSIMRYSLRIKDPSTNRKCDVYVSTDWDLESLLLFLGSGGDLEYDVRDVKKRSSRSLTGYLFDCFSRFEKA